jgi:3-oxoacyl-[acyl-carrier protein] reductase
MRARGYGRIVNVASIAGIGREPGIAAYASAKAGVIRIHQVACGGELVDSGVLVNAIALRFTETELFKE